MKTGGWLLGLVFTTSAIAAQDAPKSTPAAPTARVGTMSEQVGG